MLFYRKNIGGVWETKKLSLEEAKKIQEQIIKMSVSTYKNVKALTKAANIEISEEALAVIIDKAVPTYDSLANDMVEESLIAKPVNPQ